jgi:hypothetical protein
VNKKGNKEYEKPERERERERERRRRREMNEREWNMLWVMGMTSVELYEFCLSVCLSPPLHYCGALLFSFCCCCFFLLLLLLLYNGAVAM